MAKKKKSKDDDLMARIRANYDTATEAYSPQFVVSEEDNKFVAGEQWRAETKAKREKHKRPCEVVNRVKPTVRIIVGEFRQDKIGVRARPVGHDDYTKAQKYEGIVRRVEFRSRANQVYRWALESSAKSGLGYFRLHADYESDDTTDQELLLGRITNFASVMLDPSSVEPTGADAKWGFITDTMREQDYKREYPDSNAVSMLSARLEDREKYWIAGKTVYVAEYFEIVEEKQNLYLLESGRHVTDRQVQAHGGAIVEQGEKEYVQIDKEVFEVVKKRVTKNRKVMWYKTNGGEILDGPKVWPGKRIPIFRVAGEEMLVDNQIQYRSAIYDSKGPARIHNYAVNKNLEMVGMSPVSPFMAAAKQIKGNEDIWSEVNEKPTPVLIYETDPAAPPPIRLPGAPVDQGAAQLAASSAMDIEYVNITHAASLGARSNETSGLAINRRKMQGSTANYLFVDNLLFAIQACYQEMAEVIPSFYDRSDRVLEIIGADGKEHSETLNQAMPGGEIENDMKVGKYDVILEPGMAYSTKREAASDGMRDFISAVPALAQIIAPRLASVQDWPDADKMAQEIREAMGMQNQPSPDDQLNSARKEVDLQRKQLDLQQKTVEFSAGQQQLIPQIAQIAQQTTLAVLSELGLIQQEQNNG